jgi:peptidoglycan hydrolase-like protein with peptidoglycan-binding domain
VFAVVFSFVAANALWYQPGGHPAPWLATRDLTDPNAIAGYRPVLRAAPEEVTTFRIERAGDAAPAESAARGPANADVVPVAAPQPSAPEAPSADRQILAEVQRELSRQGLYDGADDGLMGPRTAAAILSFQELAGVPPTGAATPELLAALKARPAGRPQERTVAAPPAASPAAVVREAAPPVPAMRPAENVNAGQDPVAAAIRAAEKSPSMRPPGEIPVSARSVSAPKSPVLPTSDLVLQIQRGLSNIAYADVTVDGVAGEQTRAAIRRFEKHYRLPETGEPNEQVLRKLKSIGAL